jgi:hypothetical protein
MQNLAVTTPYGTVTLPRCFLYVYPPPAIQSTDVTTGPMTGNTTLVLRGSQFFQVSKVVVSGVDAASFTVDSPTQITCVTASTSGAIDTAGDIQVVAAFGTSTLTAAYTYFSVRTPVITFVDPVIGNTTGGDSVVMYGTNLGTTSAIAIDGNTVTAFTIDSASQLTLTTPPGNFSNGIARDIVITNAYGATTVPRTFTYVYPAPIVYNVSPTTGAVTGGNRITLQGLYFTGTTSVRVGSVEATNISVVSNTEITCTTPSATFTNNTLGITVTTGRGTYTLANAFKYLPQPTISSVTPTTCY